MGELMAQIDHALAEFAEEALLKPDGDSLFYYGKMVGYYQGLSKTKELLMNFMLEEEEKERNS